MQSHPEGLLRTTANEGQIPQAGDRRLHWQTGLDHERHHQDRKAVQRQFGDRVRTRLLRAVGRVPVIYKFWNCRAVNTDVMLAPWEVRMERLFGENLVTIERRGAPSKLVFLQLYVYPR